MQPRTEGLQRCLEFSLSVWPRAEVTSYHDHLGNVVHHFDVPGLHAQLTLTAQALVTLDALPPLPDTLPTSAWDKLDQLATRWDFWDDLQPSRFTTPTPALKRLGEELGVDRSADPLTLMRTLNERIYNAFGYAPQSTEVDSLIDEAIATRRGVCQDYAHIMIALVRGVGIPCRYVSGYLFHRVEDQDRSAEDATHAWIEAYLPGLGWIGFDPTNNLIAADRHIRVAVGRDYSDVPPTRGVFKGEAESDLEVGVRVTLASAPQEAPEEILPDTPWDAPSLEQAAAAQQ